MNRIFLSTDDIFMKSKQRIKVLTSGINISNFLDNPIMLYEHNPEKNLGKWDSIEKKDNSISAIPLFDDDQLSVEISKKYEKNSIKSASVGLEINDAYMEGDIFVISSCELLEASIVSIPANSKAKKIEYNKDVMFFSGTDNDFDTIIEKYKNKNMDNLILSTEPTEIKVEETKIEVASSVEQEITKTELEEAKIELEKCKIELETAKLELEKVKLEMQEMICKNEKLSKESEIQLSNLKSVSEELNKMKFDKLEKLIDSAIELGKVTKESKIDFLGLSYEKAESLLSKMIPQQISLSQALSQKKIEGEYKSYDWYLKNDKLALSKLSKENPILYKQIELEYINKIK
jgi:HK97 family phage prohead protease